MHISKSMIVSVIAVSLISSNSVLAFPPLRDDIKENRGAEDRRENPHHKALYNAAHLEWDLMEYRNGKKFDHSIRLLNIIINDSRSRHTSKAKRLLADIYFKTGEYRKAEELYEQIGDELNRGICVYKSGNFEKAKAIFTNELAKPDKHSMFDEEGNPLISEDDIGDTPVKLKLGIWLARCTGKLGERAKARDDLYGLLGKTSSYRNFSEQDRFLADEVLLENSLGDSAAMNRLRQYSKTDGYSFLKEYFDIQIAVSNGDIGRIVDYLACPDRFAFTYGTFPRHIAWREYILPECAGRYKKEILSYLAGELKKLVSEVRDQLWFERLFYVLRDFHDPELARIVFENPVLQQRYIDGSRAVVAIMSAHRAQFESSVLSLLADNSKNQNAQYGQESALSWIYTYELFTKDIIDVVAGISRNEYHPVQEGSIIIFWKISGDTFGWITGNDADKKNSLQKAREWWASYSRDFKPQQKVPNVVAEKVRLLGHKVDIPGEPFIGYIGKMLSDMGDKIILTPALMHCVKDDMYPVFYYSPRETIEYHLRQKSDEALRHLTGVRFNNLKDDKLFKAWDQWWKENRVYYDFGMEEK
jgi:hypothetical protein